MKKANLVLFLAGALIASGMIVSFYGSVLTTQDLTIAEGTVNSSSPLQVTKTLDPQVNTVGAFVVHAENFADNSLDVRLYDPSGAQIEEKKITDKSTEQKFEVSSKGEYKLILEDSGQEASATIGLIHYPEDWILAMNIVGEGIIISGFVGVAASLIFLFKSRRKDIS